jgi:tetratricopeptide (TPR) repeat protein
VGRTLSSLGNAARAKGDYEGARRYLEQSLAWARERDFSWAIASGLTDLGHVACEQDDFARAMALYRESLGLYRTMRNPTALAWCLEGVVVATVAGGEYERAARLGGAITGLRAAAGAAPAPSVWPPYVRACEAARQALGAESFAAVSAEGAALSPEGAIAFVLRNDGGDGQGGRSTAAEKRIARKRLPPH